MLMDYLAEHHALNKRLGDYDMLVAPDAEGDSDRNEVSAETVSQYLLLITPVEHYEVDQQLVSVSHDENWQ